MEIPLSDDKYWAIKLLRVQKTYLVFRVFFWCYNNVTWDLLHAAVSFNLVFLASMSILDTPPGATWKIKFLIIALLYGNSMQAIMSWTLRRSHLQEWMKKLNENDYSECWAAEAKQSAGVLRVLTASMVHAGLIPNIAWNPGSPPSPLPSFWKFWGRVNFSEGSLVAT